ncbi:MAG: response regulator [Myxococcota bacterium]
MLVVDDDSNTTRILSTLLRRMRCSPEIAHTTSEAVEAFGQAARDGVPFSVVFLDLTLERRDDGLGVLAHVRESAPNVDVVVCTGAPDVRPGDARFRRMGARDVVKKPFSVSEIKAAVESALVA